MGKYASYDDEFVFDADRVRLMHILILHANESFHQTRRTSFNHAFALVKYAPQHQYTLHGVHQQVTERVRQTSYDAIILDTTFLCWRWAKPRTQWLDRILDEYSFVGRSDAKRSPFRRTSTIIQNTSMNGSPTGRSI